MNCNTLCMYKLNMFFEFDNPSKWCEHMSYGHIWHMAKGHREVGWATWTSLPLGIILSIVLAWAPIGFAAMATPRPSQWLSILLWSYLILSDTLMYMYTSTILCIHVCQKTTFDFSSSQKKEAYFTPKPQFHLYNQCESSIQTFSSTGVKATWFVNYQTHLRPVVQPMLKHGDMVLSVCPQAKKTNRIIHLLGKSRTAGWWKLQRFHFHLNNFLQNWTNSSQDFAKSDLPISKTLQIGKVFLNLNGGESQLRDLCDFLAKKQHKKLGVTKSNRWTLNSGFHASIGWLNFRTFLRRKCGGSKNHREQIRLAIFLEKCFQTPNSYSIFEGLLGDFDKLTWLAGKSL